MESPPADPDVLLSALDQAPLILMVCEGPDLRVAGFSAALRALIPSRDAVGRPLREVMHELDAQGFIAAYELAYRSGEAVTGQEWRAHIDLPDGSVHELYANFSITPWRWPDGRLRGVIGCGIDVTDMVRARLEAQDQARHLRERYEQTLDVVTALQQELLPPGVPVLPGAQLAASYLLADAGTAAGGDWFDAVAQPDGRVALIVGDVVGHGVAASGVMGQLRAVLQDRLDSGAGIAEALAAADRTARRVPQAHATTIVLAVLDPMDGRLTYCTAGHPPPLLIRAGGDTRYLPGTGGTPLGTGGTFGVRTDHVDVGDLLVLYSDGILERPGRTPAASRAELARVAADSAAGRALHDPKASPAERVCTQTVELLVRATGHTDDITLLAAQRVPPPADLHLRLPARLSSLRRSRVELAAWLDAAGAGLRDIFLLQHALGELTTNAIEHAFAAGRSSADLSPADLSSADLSSADLSPADLSPADVELHLTLTATGVAEATVTDRGHWQEPSRQPLRGRGLALTAQLIDDLRIAPAGPGTIATVRHALIRPARMLTGVVPAHDRSTPPPGTMTVTELPGGDETRVRVAGPLDATNAEALRQDLLRRSRGGTVTMTVNLSDVTHLASAGVSALHQVARHHDQASPLQLQAAPGTIADQVLTLVALPHTSPDAPGAVE